MSVLAWTLTLPVASVLLATAWVWWRNRPRGPVDTFDSVAAHERFRKAIVGKQAPTHR